MSINEFEKTLDSEHRHRANSFEGRELDVESREDREAEELKKAGAMERVEKTSREIKNTQKQMKNILVNMQQVVKAVQNIRQQLNLAGGNGNIPSVAQDKKVLDNLKKKLSKLVGQLGDLRLALAQEEEVQVKKEHENWTEIEIKAEVEKRVKEILLRLGLK